MKKLLFTIAFMTVMTVICGQAYNSVSYVNGTRVSISGLGNNYTIHISGCHYTRPAYTSTHISSSTSHKTYIFLHDDNYVVGIDDNIYNYKYRNVEIPHIGSEYVIAVKEYNPQLQRRFKYWTSWRIVGTMTITSEKDIKIELTEDIDLSKAYTYIVYKEYEDFFIDKYINNMGKCKLKRKYGADLYDKEEIYDDYVKESRYFTSRSPKKVSRKVTLK